MKGMSFWKGMGAGLMVGAAVGMMVAPEKKSARRTVSKLLRAAGDVIEDLGGALGL